MLGLGNSVGTPPEGLEADLLVVSGYDELERRGARGARDASCSSTCRSRTTARRSRIARQGPSRAARAGAVACLVRSVGIDGLRTPHTGMLTYRAGRATDSRGRDRRRRRAAPRSGSRPRGERVRLRLSMDAAMHGGRRFGQRRRRDCRPRASGRDRRRRRPLRLLGRRHRRDRRWRRRASSRGKRCG